MIAHRSNYYDHYCLLKIINFFKDIHSRQLWKRWIMKEKNEKKKYIKQEKKKKIYVKVHRI